jgi:hypothetical protein
MPVPPPVAVAVEVVATQPAAADARALAAVRRRIAEQPPVTYLVTVRLEEVPPATGSGWALYIGDVRIPKYWEYPAGIYFKVYDPQFLIDRAGEPLRFSADNGVEFVETGLTLGMPDDLSRADALRADELPTQRQVLLG